MKIKELLEEITSNNLARRSIEKRAKDKSIDVDPDTVDPFDNRYGFKGIQANREQHNTDADWENFNKN